MATGPRPTRILLDYSHEEMPHFATIENLGPNFQTKMDQSSLKLHQKDAFEIETIQTHAAH